MQVRYSGPNYGSVADQLLTGAASSASAAARDCIRLKKLGDGFDDAISRIVVCENISSRLRWPSSHTRNIRQVGCKLHCVPPSTHRFSAIGPSTASITSRN